MQNATKQAQQETSRAVFVEPPDTYTLHSRRDITVAIQGKLPEDAYVLALAWSVQERAMQDAFATPIDPESPVIPWGQLDTLPLGENEIQLIVNSRSRGRIATVRHTIDVVAPAPVRGVRNLRYGFGNTPASYQIGSGDDLPFVLEGEVPDNDDILLLAWSVTESRMVNEFAFVLTDGTPTIPAEKLALLPLGQAELQIAYRQGGKIRDKVKHLITVDYAVPSVSMIGLPDSFLVGGGSGIRFGLSNPLPSDAELTAVILNEQGQTVSTHAVNQREPALAAEAFNGLSEGGYQLAVVIRLAGDEVARFTDSFVVQALPEPEPEPQAPVIAYESGGVVDLVRNDGQSVPYNVTGDVNDSFDLVVQAWSITNNELVRGFAYRTAASSGSVPSDRLARLPDGDVVLQLLLRKDGRVVQQIDRRLVVQAQAPVSAEAQSIRFAQNDTLRVVQGQVPAISYTVDGSGDGHDLLILVWSNEQGALVQSMTRVLQARSGSLDPGLLAQLPQGRNELQIHLRDGDAQKVQTIRLRIDVAAPPQTPVDQPVEDAPSTESPSSDPTDEPNSEDPPSEDSAGEDTTNEDAGNEDPANQDPADDEPTEDDPADPGPIDPGADTGTAGSAALGFVALSPSSGTQMIYVSSSLGDDSNNGLSPQKAVQTPERGYELLRNGRPDWLLFKAGDSFRGGLPQWTKSGESSSRPMVVGVYGEGARPIFYTDGEGLLSSQSKSSDDDGVRHLRVIGLHAYANLRDPNSPDFNGGRSTETGVRWMANSDDILFEDLKIEYFKDGIVLQGGNWGFPMRNVTVRRCILVNQYADEDRVGHSQGMYITRSENVWVDQCFFDHNGWNEQVSGAERVKFNHNIYCSSNNQPIKVTACILARGASHGLQLRPGGLIEHNFVYRNAMAFFTTKTDSVVRYNVVMEGDDMNAEEGRGVGIEVFSLPNATVSHNIVSQRDSRTTRQGMDISASDRLDAENNIVWDWLNSKGQGVRINGGSGVQRGNIDASPDRLGSIRFIDPSRTLSSFAQARGLGQDGFDVLEAAGNRPRGQWSDELSARGINSYIRAGFDFVPFD
ncbi:MAG: right-handed parallel beta-helix repeat-containing protein [Planctomycetota bacterium]